MTKPEQTQQMIENQLGKFKFPSDEQKATYQEAYGPMSDWILNLEDHRLLLDPVLQEWFYFDRLHQQWAKTGFGPGEVIFMVLENKLGFKRIPDALHAETIKKTLLSLQIGSPDFPDPLPITGVLHIGRSNQNEIVLKDEQASRVHAQFTWNGAALMIEDLKTTNGTEVNGVEIQAPTELKPGDEIVVGDTRMHVIVVEEENRG